MGACPAIIALLCFCVAALGAGAVNSASDANGFNMMFLLLLLALAWFAFMLAAAARTASMWRSVCLVIAILTAVPASLACWQGGDRVHLLIMLPSYMRRVAAHGQTHFDWGVHSLLGGGILRTLVFDADHATPFMASLSENESKGCPVMSTPLLLHYYLVEARC